LVLATAGRRPPRREQPVPIASLAKVMTAYLTLQRYPLSGAHDGSMITITAAQADAATEDAADQLRASLSRRCASRCSVTSSRCRA
jgi:D-alanyl-D-alanine carboxypeptidase